MKIKDGVSLCGLKLAMRYALVNAEKIWNAYGQDLVVTSGTNGEHSAGSLHYYGFAVDFRNRYFSAEDKLAVVSDLSEALSLLSLHYLVLLEDDHVHVEYRRFIDNVGDDLESSSKGWFGPSVDQGS